MKDVRVSALFTVLTECLCQGFVRKFRYLHWDRQVGIHCISSNYLDSLPRSLRLPDGVASFKWYL